MAKLIRLFGNPLHLLFPQSQKVIVLTSSSLVTAKKHSFLKSSIREIADVEADAAKALFTAITNAPIVLRMVADDSIAGQLGGWCVERANHHAAVHAPLNKSVFSRPFQGSLNGAYAAPRLGRNRLMRWEELAGSRIVKGEEQGLIYLHPATIRNTIWPVAFVLKTYNAGRLVPTLACRALRSRNLRTPSAGFRRRWPFSCRWLLAAAPKSG